VPAADPARLAGTRLARLDAAPALGPFPAIPGPVTPAAPATASGLPWRSGASCGHGAFEAWRGRKLDVQVQFVWHDSWDQMAARMNSPYFRTALTWTPQPVVSLAMLPASARQQHAACAKGAFDGYFRQFGRILTAAGAGDAVVRVGWEPNTGTQNHPWGFDTADRIPAYVGCFRHAAAALRATMPGVRIEWGVSKAGVWTFSVLKAYPGDAYVDLIGAHYYDVGAQFTRQGAFDNFLDATRYGGPQGLNTWLPVVAAHGKLLDVPEWGVWARHTTAAASDSPVYIQGMYQFFKAHAAQIAYENYYNCADVHQLGTTTQFPNASAMYQRLWSAGR
jgi:hypothetical protein